jgi:hypothetical protein
MDARYGRILVAKAREEFVTIRPRGPMKVQGGGRRL